jgi:hypothetical protein
MNTLYNPRWRNAVKGVRYSYDTRLGGGNILAWSLGSQGIYDRKLSKPMFWRNLLSAKELAYSGSLNELSYYPDTSINEPVYYSDSVIATAEEQRLAVIAAANLAAMVEQQRITAETAEAEQNKLAAEAKAAQFLLWQQKIAEEAARAAKEAADIAAATAANGTPAAAELAAKTAVDLKSKADQAEADLINTTKPLKQTVTESGMSPIYIAGGIAVAGILALIFKK